jgi:two-component system nitrate/nitrite response regulator NarL
MASHRRRPRGTTFSPLELRHFSIEPRRNPIKIDIRNKADARRILLIADRHSKRPAGSFNFVEVFMESVGVFLVDRNQLFREGLKRLLDPREYPIVGEARCLGEAELASIRQAKPGLLVIDIEGVDANHYGPRLEELRRERPDTKIIVLTGDTSRATFMKALAMSVDAYLFKDMSADALIRSFQVVTVGQQIFPTALIMSRSQSDSGETVPLLNYLSAGIADAAPVDQAVASGLTPREMDILRALVKGHSNKMIARELSISEGHVKVYLKTLLRKMRVKNRTQAAVWALHNGFSQWVAGSLCLLLALTG